MKIRTNISRKRLMYRHLSYLKLFKKDVFRTLRKGTFSGKLPLYFYAVQLLLPES